MHRRPAFPPDATECDCAELARKTCRLADAGRTTETADIDEVNAFTALIDCWVNLAYAGKFPPDENFEAAIAFCKSLAAPHA
jgi:hypothetical protein